jgi:heptosyltransferase-2
VGWRSFWGIWNRLPYGHRNAHTATWLRRPDEQAPAVRLAQETLRRVLLLYASGQGRRHRRRIPREARSIIWLHFTDHIGDSLMRLSSTQMLADRRVDLLATGKAAALFEPGGMFCEVLRLPDDEDAAQRNGYDFVIIDALQTKPLLAKRRLFPCLPFVTQNEYFHYCRDDYNLSLNSWYRMAHLLGRDPLEAEGQARLRMDCDAVWPGLPARLGIGPGTIALCLGGREDYRIYRGWGRVAELLCAARPRLPLALVGSDNSEEPAARIAAAHNKAKIVNLANRLSIKETAALVRSCRLLVCADGGLLHVANAVGTPTVGLFAQELPEFRYLPTDRYRALCAEENVNAIAPEAVAAEVLVALDEAEA